MSQSISEPTTGEYDAINFDGLERRANYRTIAYREDILHILEHKDAAAIIYQIISRWQTEIKRPQILKEIERRKQTKQPPLTTQEVENMMWVYMSYNDFVRESGGAVAYNTVIRMMHYLVNAKKVVEQRENHDPRYPDYEYRINKDTVKELLKALPTEPAFSPKVPKKKEKSTQEGTGSDNSTQEGIPPQEYTLLGTEYTQEGIATTHLGTEVYPNGGTSHITHNYTHNYNTEQERESTPNTLDTHTIVSSDTAHADDPLTAFDEKMTIKEAEIRQMLEGVASEEIIQQTIETFRKAVLAHRETRYHELPMPTTYAQAVIYLAPHGGVPPGYDAVEVMSLAQKLYAEAHSQDEEVFRNDEPQGDTHATAAPRHPHRDSALPAPGVDGAGSPSQDRPLVAPKARPVLEAQEQVTQTPPTTTPAQSLSLPQAEQAASGAKWNAQAMVARACELRGKPFSDTARPKETKAAQKLFARKPDLTEEEFERAFQQWNTQWWRDTNGLFNLTDLAAVPKNKSEMRLIIALEKLALAKTITRQSGQIIPISGTKRYSSYDDPNFSSEQDFYPVEGGSYAAAGV